MSQAGWNPINSSRTRGIHSVGQKPKALLSEVVYGQMKDRTARALGPSIQKVSSLGEEPFTCNVMRRPFRRCRATRAPSSVTTPPQPTNPARASFQPV